MEDYLLVDFLRKQGIGHNMSDEEFTWKFKEFLREHSHDRKGRMKNMMDWEDYNEDYNDRRGYGGYLHMKDYDHSYPYDMPKYPYNVTFNRYQGYPYKNSMSEINHLDEHEAREIVNHMYHTYNGNRVSGEVFSMDKAREVYNQHHSSMRYNPTIEEVYVAINAQYHDYCPLFKQWFGSHAENKIIETAILFWFKDEDYDKGSKVLNYFS